MKLRMFHLCRPFSRGTPNCTGAPVMPAVPSECRQRGQARASTGPVVTPLCRCRGGPGLAPHHDAVELFVCQTAGSKTWRLYRPVNGHALPALPSGDLPPSLLGEPIAEVTLQARAPEPPAHEEFRV